MEDLLNIKDPVVYDESIANYELHAHTPYATSTFRNTEEIDIIIQHQDQCLLTSKSALHIQGKLEKITNIRKRIQAKKY